MSATLEQTPAGAKREILGDVDLAAGDIEHQGDLHIHGNVTDGRSVKASGSIVIDGVAQLACVEARGSLTVAGGIKAGDKGRFWAGGNVFARYIANATLATGANVVVTRELINSRVVCGGRLIVRQGSLVAGQTVATGGLRCKILGAPGGSVRTVIEVGIDLPFRSEIEPEIAQIDAWIAESTRIRKNVAPLLQHRKALTAEQKEHATILVFEADAMENQIENSIGKLRARYQAAVERCNPRVRVMELIQPPVTIRMPGIEADINEEIRGPLWIVVMGTAKGRYIAVKKGGRVIAALPTRDVPFKALDALRKLLKVPPTDPVLA